MNNAVLLLRRFPPPHSLIHLNTWTFTYFLTQSLNTLLSLNHYKLEDLFKLFLSMICHSKPMLFPPANPAALKLNSCGSSHAWKVYSMTYCGHMVRHKYFSMHDILKAKEFMCELCDVMDHGCLIHYQSPSSWNIPFQCTSVGWLNQQSAQGSKLVCTYLRLPLCVHCHWICAWPPGWFCHYTVIKETCFS